MMASVLDTGQQDGFSGQSDASHQRKKAVYSKIYENLRTAVARGKKSNNFYEVVDAEDLLVNSGSVDLEGLHESADSISSEEINKEDMKGVYRPKSSSPILSGAVGHSDSSATEDSGIDSICWDNNHTGSASDDSEARGEVRDGLREITEADIVKHKVKFADDESPPGRSPNGHQRLVSRSFLYDTYNTKEKRRRHEMNNSSQNSVWRKELVISGKNNFHSNENACDDYSAVLLKSVKHHEDSVPLYSSVNKANKRKNANNARPRGATINDAPVNVGNDYAAVNDDDCDRRSSSNSGDDGYENIYENTRDLSNYDGKLTVKDDLQGQSEDDIYNRHYDDADSTERRVLKQVTLGTFLGKNGVPQNLEELTQILADTNSVLQRNSNLRASLTISVKARPPCLSTSRSTPTTARKSKTRHRVRFSPTLTSEITEKSSDVMSSFSSGQGHSISKLPSVQQLALGPHSTALKGSPHVKRRFAVNQAVGPKLTAASISALSLSPGSKDRLSAGTKQSTDAQAAGKLLPDRSPSAVADHQRFGNKGKVGTPPGNAKSAGKSKIFPRELPSINNGEEKSGLGSKEDGASLMSFMQPFDQDDCLLKSPLANITFTGVLEEATKSLANVNSHEGRIPELSSERTTHEFGRENQELVNLPSQLADKPTSAPGQPLVDPVQQDEEHGRDASPHPDDDDYCDGNDQKSRDVSIDHAKKLEDPFIRSYRTRNGTIRNGGFRMSMSVRPHTVANLTKQFDAILTTQKGKTEKNVNFSPSSKHVTLRSYDITTIISQLNQLNDSPRSQNERSSRRYKPERSMASTNSEALRPSNAASRDQDMASKSNQKTTAVSSVQEDSRAGSNTSLKKTNNEKAVVERYLSAVTSNSGSVRQQAGRKPTKSSVPATATPAPSVVKKTQLLLLEKTGGIPEESSKGGTDRLTAKRKPTLQEPSTKEESNSASTKTRPVQESHNVTGGAKNPVDPRAAKQSKADPTSDSGDRSSGSNKLENPQKTSNSPKRTEEASGNENTEAVSTQKNAEDTPYKNISEAINCSQVVTAVPAVILEDLDTLSLYGESTDLYKPIGGQKYPDEPMRFTDSDTYSDYSDINARSIHDVFTNIHDDRRNYRFLSKDDWGSFRGGSNRSSIMETGSSRAASSLSSASVKQRGQARGRGAGSITSERSDDWIDIETDEESEGIERHVTFARNSVRFSTRRSYRGSANIGKEWNKAVRDFARPTSIQGPEGEANDVDDIYESIYEVIQRSPGDAANGRKHKEDDSEFEEVPEDVGDESINRSSKRKSRPNALTSDGVGHFGSSGQGPPGKRSSVSVPTTKRSSLYHNMRVRDAVAMYNSKSSAVTTDEDGNVTIGLDGGMASANLKWKLAEAANKKMRKLRTNFSQKKSDLTRSLSRIKRRDGDLVSDSLAASAGGPLGDIAVLDVGKDSPFASGNARRRSIRKSASSVTGQTGQLKASHLAGQPNQDSPMFYITLTIEEEGQPINLHAVAEDGNKINSDSPCSQEKTRQIANTTADIIKSGPTPAVGRHTSASGGKNRKKAAKNYSIMRPGVPPPAPPPSSLTLTSVGCSQPPLEASSPVSSSSSSCSPASSPCSALSTPLSGSTKGNSPVNGQPGVDGDHDDPGNLQFSEMKQPTIVISSASSDTGTEESERSDSLLPCDSLPISCVESLESIETPSESVDGSQQPAESESSYKEFYIGFCSEEESPDTTLLQLPEETYTSSLFQTEPLYQFYDNNNNRNGNANEHTYEAVKGGGHKISASQLSPASNLDVEDVWKGSAVNKYRKKRSSAMDIVISSTGRRSLWAELPEVIESGILRTITRTEKKLQEAMFEVISSEASYLKSLNILISHFVQSKKLSGDQAVITKRDQRILFSEAIQVRACSERFLADLESRWQASVMLSGIAHIIRDHAKHHFQVYVKYCSNQVYQDRTLKKLQSENPKFLEALKELESSQVCQSLAVHSFLMLPMQRITRLPLLTEAIISRLPADSSELEEASEALETLGSLVKECNESARNMERMEELLLLSQQLDFRDVKPLPLISASRWLVKRGQILKICTKDGNESGKLTFGRRVQKQALTLFLLTDLLLVTKKRKGEERFLVQDYCPRNLVTITRLDTSDTLPAVCESSKSTVWLSLLQNWESKTQEFLISFPSGTERERWEELINPPISSEVSGEKIYEGWDCPKVEVTQSFKAEKPGEVDVERSDIANVLKKSTEGYVYIERRRDGSKGWIPSIITNEIQSDHLRAKNFKQRYLFLKSLSEEFAEENFD